MSITSMSNRARLAENLSIQQLQQSIQDGVIPSYIGVPLLQEKVKDAKLLQAAKAAQNAMQQPSVAQQVMQQAQQVEQGVPSLPTNLPQVGMAGGGIVAFAEGGMYDDEETDEDRLDEARRAEADALMDEYAQAFQGGIGQLPAAAAAAPSDREGIAGGDIADFVAKIMHKESRGRRYGRDGELLTSEKGAKGEMQVMPGTSRDPGFGVKPARDDSPDELARVGRDYAQVLLSRYGDPKLAAIAYNMGPGATDKWLAAGADVSKLPRETQGYVKGFSGEDGESEVKDKYKGVWPYNAPEAGKFTYGDTLDEDVKKALAFSAAPLAAAGDVLLSPVNALRKMVRNPLDRSESPSMTPIYDARNRYLYGEGSQPVAAAAEKGLPEIARGRPTMKNDPRLIGAAQPEAAKVSAYDAEDARVAPAPAKGIAEIAQEKVDPYAEFKDLFAKREANLAKQREQDKYMALLQAGLGMMGGTSQHALANIGAGATQGIQSLAEARKAATAEENALLSGRLGLAKIGSAKEQADQMMQLRRDLAKKADERARDLATASLEEKQLRRTEGTEQKAMQRLADISKNAEIQAEKAISANTALNFAADREAKKQAMIADILRRNAAYAKTYKMVHGPDADPFEGLGQSGGGGTRIRFDAQGNMIQ